MERREREERRKNVIIKGNNKKEKEGGDGRGYAIDRGKDRSRDMEDRGG